MRSKATTLLIFFSEQKSVKYCFRIRVVTCSFGISSTKDSDSTLSSNFLEAFLQLSVKSSAPLFLEKYCNARSNQPSPHSISGKKSSKKVTLYIESQRYSIHTIGIVSRCIVCINRFFSSSPFSQYLDKNLITISCSSSLLIPMTRNLEYHLARLIA